MVNHFNFDNKEFSYNKSTFEFLGITGNQVVGKNYQDLSNLLIRSEKQNLSCRLRNQFHRDFHNYDKLLKFAKSQPLGSYCDATYREDKGYLTLRGFDDKRQLFERYHITEGEVVNQDYHTILNILNANSEYKQDIEAYNKICGELTSDLIRPKKLKDYHAYSKKPSVLLFRYIQPLSISTSEDTQQLSDQLLLPKIVIYYVRVMTNQFHAAKKSYDQLQKYIKPLKSGGCCDPNYTQGTGYLTHREFNYNKQLFEKCHITEQEVVGKDYQTILNVLNKNSEYKKDIGDYNKVSDELINDYISGKALKENLSYVQKLNDHRKAYLKNPSVRLFNYVKPLSEKKSLIFEFEFQDAQFKKLEKYAMMDKTIDYLLLGALYSTAVGYACRSAMFIDCGLTRMVVVNVSLFIVNLLLIKAQHVVLDHDRKTYINEYSDWLESKESKSFKSLVQEAESNYYQVATNMVSSVIEPIQAMRFTQQVSV